MDNSHSYKKLLYDHEVLWALYEIKNHYLSKVAQEVYDNISQLLYYVRIQLSRLSMEKHVANAEITDSGDWVSKAITELRFMRNNSDPETEILEKAGLIKTLEYEVNLVCNDEVQKNIKVQGKPFLLNKGTEFIVFRMLQELLFSLRPSAETTRLDIDIIYKENYLIISLKANGIPLVLNNSSRNTDELMNTSRSTLLERASLIEGDLVTSCDTAGLTRIDLKIPKTISFL